MQASHWLPVTNGQALRFFFERLKDVSEDADPFHERHVFTRRRTLGVLGADIEFRSNDARLLDLAAHAFGNLPRHRWRRARCQLRIDMRLVARVSRSRSQPPTPRFTSGAGCLVAAIDARRA